MPARPAAVRSTNELPACAAPGAGDSRDRVRTLLFFTPWVSVPLALLGISLVLATPLVVLVPYAWLAIPALVAGGGRAGADAALALPAGDPRQLPPRRRDVAPAPPLTRYVRAGTGWTSSCVPRASARHAAGPAALRCLLDLMQVGQVAAAPLEAKP